jgi:hypothetical protein
MASEADETPGRNWLADILDAAEARSDASGWPVSEYIASQLAALSDSSEGPGE